MIRMFDMFTGIGGFSLSAKRVFGEDLEIVGFSEIDKYAVQIYNKHFEGVKNYGDATKLIPAELPDFDLLTGGFPCQAFSIAGKRKGFEDTRGTLFFDVIRVCSVKQPKFILLENVKGLLSHDKGRTFQIILETLDEAGYYVKWNVYNSKNFGVPQNRERVYFQCFNKRHFGEGSIGEILYIQSLMDKEHNEENQVGEQTAYCLTARGYKSWNGNYIKLLHKGHQTTNVYDTEGIGVTLSANGGGWGGKTGLYKTEDRIRRLTPTECERLQGYPDNWTEGISDTQRYKCCGNSITVNVARDIFIKYKGIING